MFNANTIYIVGYAKSQLNNPITYQYGRFLLCFVIDKDTGVIQSCSGTTVMKVTEEFLHSLFIGRAMLDDGDAIIDDIKNRYFGASQKALVVAFRDAQKRFRNYQKGMLKDLAEFDFD